MSFTINRVYTRSGDTGDTGLVGGTRVSKSDIRVCAVGEIDEVNSFLGLIKTKLTGKFTELQLVIENLQQQLFDLGAEMATLPKDHYAQMWMANEKHVLELELLCDKYGKDLPELKSFILPGGNEVAALFHVIRSVARRAERTIVELKKNEEVNPMLIKYFNRLSDLFFVLARYVLNVDGIEPPLWIQEKSRTTGQ